MSTRRALASRPGSEVRSAVFTRLKTGKKEFRAGASRGKKVRARASWNDFNAIAKDIVGRERSWLLKRQHEAVVLVALLVDVEVARIFGLAQHAAFFGQSKTRTGHFLDHELLIDPVECFSRLIAGPILRRVIDDSVDSATL